MTPSPPEPRRGGVSTDKSKCGGSAGPAISMEFSRFKRAPLPVLGNLPPGRGCHPGWPNEIIFPRPGQYGKLAENVGFLGIAWRRSHDFQRFWSLDPEKVFFGIPRIPSVSNEYCPEIGLLAGERGDREPPWADLRGACPRGKNRASPRSRDPFRVAGVPLSRSFPRPASAPALRASFERDPFRVPGVPLAGALFRARVHLVRTAAGALDACILRRSARAPARFVARQSTPPNLDDPGRAGC